MAGTTTDFQFGEAVPIPRTQAGRDATRRLRRIERLAWVLDRSIPLGRWRIGLDPLLGLLPGFGDWIGALLSLYVLYEGVRLGLRGGVLVRMTLNILVETVVGAVPVLGDVFDFAWQANTRNLALIRRHYRPGLEPRSLAWVGATVAVAAALVLALAVGFAILVVNAFQALWH